MLNFRARPSLESLINEAVERTGMDRSSFIREACEEKALAVLSGPQIVLGAETAPRNGDRPQPPQERPRVKVEDCSHPKESLNFIPGVNLRLCTLCGARF